MAKDNDLKILQINQIIAIRNSVLRMAGTHHLKLGLTIIKYLRFEWHGPIVSDLGLFANIEKFIEGIRKLFRR